MNLIDYHLKILVYYAKRNTKNNASPSITVSVHVDISTVADMYLIRTYGCGGGNVCCLVRALVMGAPVPPCSTLVRRVAAALLVIDAMLGSGKRFSALSGRSGWSSLAANRKSIDTCSGTNSTTADKHYKM